jgi:cyclopropane fatty-acyl-phospholipid synthase-like methyltransferase
MDTEMSPGSLSQLEVPDEWYRAAYPPEMAKLPWAQKTGSEVDRLITMLKPRGGERILDLACGTGRHSLELVRRGFEVVGVELLEENVEVAEQSAQTQSLNAEFIQADLRELQFDAEFDIVLSLNDGAIGYFPSDEENRRIFEVISRALRESGRHLAQLPNVLHAERFMPLKDWIRGSEAIELIDHHWNPRTRCLEGTTNSIWIGEVFEKFEPLPFRKRLYSVEELREIYASSGMTLTNTFRGNGKAGRPRNTQYEVFIEAQKGQAVPAL